MARPGIDQKYRDKKKKEWVETYGRLCAGWGVAPHTIPEGVQIHWDHIVPKSKGGSEYGPGQVLCKPCNEHKHNTDPREIMERFGDTMTNNPLCELDY